MSQEKLRQQRRSKLTPQMSLPQLLLSKFNNSELKRQTGLQVCRDNNYRIPKLDKIKYAPVQDQSKADNQLLLLDSFMQNTGFNELKEKRGEAMVKANLHLPEQSLQHTKSVPLFARVSREASFEFYNCYKKKTDRASLFEDVPKGLPEAVLAKTEQNGVLPRCLGLIKPKGSVEVLDASHFKLGDKYIEALAAGLQKAPNVQRCLLAGNRLTDEGLKILISKLPKGVTELDLSTNCLKSLGQQFATVLLSDSTHIEKINLGNNKLTTSTVQSLCRCAIYKRSLHFLDLSSNSLPFAASQFIAQLIQRSPNLDQLYLGFNLFGGAGGAAIFAALKNNKRLKVLDLRVNHLAESQKQICAQQMSDCLKVNRSLQHLDVSSNNFSQEASAIIASGLKENHTLLGFHYADNFGYVDACGYLVPMINKAESSQHSAMPCRIKGMNISFQRHSIGLESQHLENVCWVCEGWREETFTFTMPNGNHTDKKSYIYLHFDYERYEPRLISMGVKEAVYRTMVPPGRIRYFFSFDMTPACNTEEPISLLPLPQSHTYEAFCEEYSFKVTQVHQRSGAAVPILNSDSEYRYRTFPREKKLIAVKDKEIWTYEKSVWFKEWKLENEQLTQKCFEKDWECSKIRNLVKVPAEQEKAKAILSKHYFAIKQLYRHFSAWSPFGDVWAISNNAFTEFCGLLHICSKQLPLKIIDLTFITTNSISGADWKGSQLVPERGLIRFQFMECLVRLADQKYKKTGQVSTVPDAIEVFMNEHIVPNWQSFKGSNWRHTHYFCEAADNLIRAYRPVFNHLYKRNSKLKVRPGEKPFMCLEEFKVLIDVSSEQKILERDIFLSFNNAMATQVDQLTNERFIRMTEIEFIEGVARCAFELPADCESVSQTFMSPFARRFQWLILSLLSRCCSEEFKMQFEPRKSNDF